MLLNPYQPLPTLPGSRILTETLGLVGVLLEDPHTSGRHWTIYGVFAPVAGRAFSGIRVKLVDEEGFVSFLNQRDLELLLDLARPGDWCSWLQAYYPGINDHADGWFGLCCDDEDLRDDLHERELILRQQYGGILPDNLELTRLVHLDEERERQELLLFLWDKDPETNYAPDPRLETITRRWTTIERTPVWSSTTRLRGPRK